MWSVELGDAWDLCHCGVELLDVCFLPAELVPPFQDAAVKAVEKYGVGSCGPRPFYGTMDVHLALERQLAAFMGCPESTIFSFDIATVASVIPACGNRKDIMIADEV